MNTAHFAGYIWGGCPFYHPVLIGAIPLQSDSIDYYIPNRGIDAFLGVRQPLPCVAGHHSREIVLSKIALEGVNEIGEPIVQYEIIALKARWGGVAYIKNFFDVIEVCLASLDSHLAGEFNGGVKCVPKRRTHCS